MNTARRWYIYLVCAVSLQAAIWAVIALLRNLLAGGGGGVTAIAFQIATIIIALPVFLAHWLWAQRLADREINEREAGLRGIYHYATMAGFLGPAIANAYAMVSFILWVAIGKPGYDYSHEGSTIEGIHYNLIAIVVCALLWFYQKSVLADDLKNSPESGGFGAMRRLYVFVFGAWGVTMTTMAVIHILRWILFRFGGAISLGNKLEYLMDEIARLIVGVPLWLVFWRRAQSLFSRGEESERGSALRKFYLYSVVFIAALTAVTNATGILAGLFRRILGLSPEGDIRQPLPIIAGMAVLWAYHAFVLKEDASASAESAKQGGVRRLYLYLVAAVGLAAFLVGVSGDLSVFIRLLTQGFGESLKEQLAWFTAALLAGLPVWLIPWRQAQIEAVSPTPEGTEARRSTARKIYLYFYLFISTMTVLSSVVYVLYRILSLMLGARSEGNLLSGIAQALAYSLVGVGVWLYHGSALRGDAKASRSDLLKRLEGARVAILAEGESGFGQALFERLQQTEPDLNFDLIPISSADEESRRAATAKLNEAGVIVSPWSAAVEGGGAPPEITRALATSKARKILIPMRVNGWDLAGVDDWNTDGLIQQTARAVKQWSEGEEVKAARPMGIGGIILTIIGVLIALALLVIPLLEFFL